MAAKSKLREYLESLLFSVTIVLFARAFLVEAVQIPTGSMENTLLPGDHLLINKFTFRQRAAVEPRALLPFSEIRRKDVVIFRFLADPAEPKYYVKRVVGLPGETVEIRAKQIYVNGRALDEPYALFKEPARSDFRPRDYYGPATVPDGHFFVLGDNRDRSYDSRYWGFLPRERIVGKPLFVWWSFDKATAEPPASNLAGRLDRLRGVLTRFFSRTRWSRTGKAIG